MDAQILFRSDDIVVTPAVARFGPVSYQIATIASVGVHHRQKLNPIALMLGLAALGLGILAIVAREQYSDYGLWSMVAAPVALGLGVIWQWFRPVLEYHFVMKMIGDAAETMATLDRKQAFDLRAAFESAFMIRRSDVTQRTDRPRGDQSHANQSRTDPSPSRSDPSPSVASPALSGEQPEGGVVITRDWVVANTELAPR
jgi:hypothetical protein